MMNDFNRGSSLRVGFIVSMAFLALSQPVLAERYEFKVEHRHLLGNCRGVLIIDRDHIEYQTDHKKDARVWRYDDIKRIEIISPTAINIITYEDQGKFFGADRRFELKLLKQSITQEVNNALLLRVKRPMVTGLSPHIDHPPRFEVPVKHRHTFGGCEGVLKIYSDAIVYESRQPKHSRYWRYSDVRQIGRLGAYRFEITTFEDQMGGPSRVFNFELKRRMDDAIYNYMWVRANRIKNYLYEPEPPADVTPTRNTTRVTKTEEAQSEEKS